MFRFYISHAWTVSYVKHNIQHDIWEVFTFELHEVISFDGLKQWPTDINSKQMKNASAVYLGPRDIS